MLIGDYGSCSSSEDEEPTKIVVEEKEIPKRKRGEEEEESNLKKNKTAEVTTNEEVDPFAGLVCSFYFLALIVRPYPHLFLVAVVRPLLLLLR